MHTTTHTQTRMNLAQTSSDPAASFFPMTYGRAATSFAEPLPRGARAPRVCYMHSASCIICKSFMRLNSICARTFKGLRAYIYHIDSSGSARVVVVVVVALCTCAEHIIICDSAAAALQVNNNLCAWSR